MPQTAVPTQSMTLFTPQGQCSRQCSAPSATLMHHYPLYSAFSVHWHIKILLVVNSNLIILTFASYHKDNSPFSNP